MAHPRPGSAGVDPQTEILVVFEHPFVKQSDCNIKVDGQWAVRNGQVCAGFRTTRLQESPGKIKWGIRCPGGLLPRDVLVQGWCFHNCQSIEQRFFVQGAKHKQAHPVDEQWVFTNGGVFSSNDRPFPSGVSVSDEGLVKMGDKEWAVPKDAICDIMDVRVVDGRWVFVSSDGIDHTWVITPTWMQRFKFGSTVVKVTDHWIHAQSSTSKSLHLPVGYEPSFNEIDESGWFSFSHQGKWTMIFSSDLHIWWNKDKLIAKLEPDPFTGDSDDILWTKNDVDLDKLGRVEILSTVNVMINGEVLIDPHAPEIL